jgi:hypothetical protein
MRAWPFQLRRLPISAAQVVQSPLLKRCQATVTVDANVEQVPRNISSSGREAIRIDHASDAEVELHEQAHVEGFTWPRSRV